MCGDSAGLSVWAGCVLDGTSVGHSFLYEPRQLPGLLGCEFMTDYVEYSTYSNSECATWGTGLPICAGLALPSWPSHPGATQMAAVAIWTMAAAAGHRTPRHHASLMAH